MMAAYLIGSFPTAYLVGKANGVDLRTVGSGNLGATNVFRTLGWKWGLLVYLVDGLKGALPVVLLPRIVMVAAGWPWGVAFGIVAILGHVRPVFLMGKGGGKGVATASGVFIALAPIPALCAIAGFVVVVAITVSSDDGQVPVVLMQLLLQCVILTDEEVVGWEAVCPGSFVRGPAWLRHCRASRLGL